ncbi:MAG: neutral/alkaline non-lysosomal ceramidase N-terminal domain-containing protein [Verrucomicrobiales bacterium]
MIKIYFLLAILALLPGALPAAEQEAYPWKAGMASVVITPTEAVWMAGYAGRKEPKEKVIQDLHAKALAIEDTEGGRFVVVTLDLIGVSKKMRLAIEAAMEKEHGLVPGSLLLNASHTHSGPNIKTYRSKGGKGEERVGYSRIPQEDQELYVKRTKDYLVFLHAKIGEAIGKAIRGLSPAKLVWHRARCGFSMNRRTPVEGGNFRNFPNPEGPVDQDVPVLRVADAEGELVGVLFGYACHATTMGTQEMHGDWPGYAQQYFEEDHPGAVAMFVNGCSGDQNPYPRRMQYFMERHGRSMAMAIEAALETVPRAVVGPVSSEIAWVDIPYAGPPTIAELGERIEATSGAEKAYAEFLLEELEARGSLPVSYPVPVQVARFGDSLTLVAIGGEVTVDYSLRLKREIGESTGAPVWVAGYSNDVMSYIPSDRVLREGGYEGKTSMYYSRSDLHSGSWAEGIEERLVEAAHALVRKTSGE